MKNFFIYFVILKPFQFYINKTTNFRPKKFVCSALLPYNKKNYKSWIQLGISSPQEIQKKSEHPRNDGSIVGEVLEGSFFALDKLENHNLFSQQIFGPIFDFVCICGKGPTKKLLSGDVCPKCGVEYLPASVRAKRQGYIKLAYPTVNPFYVNFCAQLLFLSREGFISFKGLKSFVFLPAYQSWTFFCSGTHFIYILKLVARLNCKFADGLKKLSKSQFFINCANLQKKRESLNLSNSFYYDALISSNLLSFYGIDSRRAWFINPDFTILPFYFMGYPFFGAKPLPWYLWRRKLDLYKFSKNPDNNTWFIKDIYGFYKKEIGSFAFKGGGDGVELLLLQDMSVSLIFKRFIHIKINTLSYLFDTQKKLKDMRNRASAFKSAIDLSLSYQSVLNFFYTDNIAPVWMTLRRIPVIPPNLRPILDLGGKSLQKEAEAGTFLYMRDIMQEGNLFISDLNELYRQIINRNNDALDFFEDFLGESIINKNIYTRFKFNSIYDLHFLDSKIWLLKDYLFPIQEAVNALFDDASSSLEVDKATKFTDLIPENPKPQSILDSLKGKYGKIRFSLLGKRVDYSGRSVIVSAPELKIYECGVPYEMILTLFYPFLNQAFPKLRLDITEMQSIYQDSDFYPYSQKASFFQMVQSVILGHPIILNRAPTLHRLGIQAFMPRLSHGKAIELHPLVCPAFNADFDGDQMAVHVPITESAQTEAAQLMASSLFIYAPATGSTLIMPTQDIILGFNFYTNDLFLKKFHLDPSVRKVKREGLFSQLHKPIWIPSNFKNSVKSSNICSFLNNKNEQVLLPLEAQLNYKGIVRSVRLNKFKIYSIMYYFRAYEYNLPIKTSLFIYNKKKLRRHALYLLETSQLMLSKHQNFFRTTLGYLCFNRYIKL